MDGSEWVTGECGWDLRADLIDELEREIADLSLHLYQYLYDVNEADGPAWLPPSGYPCCGCVSCTTREALVVLVPVIARAVTERRIRRTVEPPLGSVIPMMKGSA